MADLLFLLLRIGLFAVFVWSLWRVSQDAELRGKPGWLIAGLALLSWPIGIFLWYAARPGVKLKGPERFPGTVDCPKCGLTIQAGSSQCPSCGLQSIDVS